MPPRLIAYFPLADAAVPIDLLDLYADAGVDIVEFGWPAREPYLDGPDVRASMARAAGADPRASFGRARERLARHGRPPKALIVTYAEQGHPALDDARFFEGVDATLILAPLQDARRAQMEVSARMTGTGISAFVPLPLSADVIEPAKRATCYVMLQAAPGVTGPRPFMQADNAQRLADLRAMGVTAPIVLGFGISSGEQARAAVGLGADGVVVGSAVLRAALQGPAALATLLLHLREGLDG
jgi:tryptophan synthase alpha chain